MYYLAECITTILGSCMTCLNHIPVTLFPCRECGDVCDAIRPRRDFTDIQVPERRER